MYCRLAVKPAVIIAAIVFTAPYSKAISQWQLTMARGGPIVDIRQSGRLLVVAHSHGIFAANENGAPSIPSQPGFLSEWKYGGKLPTNVGITRFITIDSILICGTQKGLFISLDRGWNWWQAISYSISVNMSSERERTTPSNISPDSVLSKSGIRHIYVFNNEIYAVTYEGRLYMAVKDDIKRWDEKRVVFFSGDEGFGTLKEYSSRVNTVLRCENLIFVGADNGIFLSRDGGKNWIGVNSGLYNRMINSLAALGNVLFAGTNDGLYISSDNGESWVRCSIGLSDRVAFVSSIATFGIYIFCGTNIGVFVSTNSGKSWIPVGTESDSGIQVDEIARIEVVGDYIYAWQRFGILHRKSLLEIHSGSEKR